MKQITQKQAKKLFKNDYEIWVYSGDYGNIPMYEYETNEDGEEIFNKKNRLMHPKSLDMGDTLKNLLIYNNYYL